MATMKISFELDRKQLRQMVQQFLAEATPEGDMKYGCDIDGLAELAAKLDAEVSAVRREREKQLSFNKRLLACINRKSK